MIQSETRLLFGPGQLERKKEGRSRWGSRTTSLLRLIIYTLGGRSSDGYRIHGGGRNMERGCHAWALGGCDGGANHAATYIQAPYVRRRRLDWGLEPGAPGALGVQLIDDWRCRCGF